VPALFQFEEKHHVPTLVIDNVPVSLFDRIQCLAKAQQRTAGDTALAALENAFRTTAPTFAASLLPQEPFLTEDICAPCSIPWPEGTPARAVHVDAPLPTAHDVSEED
jgi:hypothetical protein